MKFANCLASLVIVFATLNAAAQVPNCSLVNGATPLEVINWQEKFKAGSDYSISDFQFSEKAIVVSGSAVDSGAQVEYFVPLKRVRQSVVADLNEGFISPSGYKYSLVYADKKSIVVTKTLQSTPTDSSDLFQLTKDGKNTTEKYLGKLVAKSFVNNMVASIIYVVEATKVYQLNVNQSTPLLFNDPKLLEMANEIKMPGLITTDGRIVYFTGAEGSFCHNCDATLNIYTPNKKSIQKTTAKLNMTEYTFTLKETGETLSMFGEAVTVKKNLWKIEIQNQTSQLFLLENNQKLATQIKSFMSPQVSSQNEPVMLGISGYPHGRQLLGRSFPSKQLFLLNARQTSCLKPTQTFIKEEKFRAVEILGDSPACTGNKASASDWDQANKKNYVSLIDKTNLTLSEVDYLLQRMLKVDRLTERDINLIDAVLKSNHIKDFEDVLSLLLNRYTIEKPTKKLLLVNQSGLNVSKLNGSFKQVCLTEKSRAELSSFYKNTLIAKAKQISKDSPKTFNIQSLLYMRDYSKILSAADKEEIAGEMGTLLAESVRANSTELRDVFFSTLDWMSTQKVKTLLGIAKIPLTDLVVLPRDSYYFAYILGTDEVMNSDLLQNSPLTRSAGGFYGLGPAYFPAQTEGTTKVDWLHNNDNFSADLILKKRKSEFVVPIVEAPNKAELLADKIYRGVVVFGSNINLSTTESTRDSYVEYLEQNNFKISAPVQLTNPLEYLEKGMTTKDETIDYLLKEAHSDGDYRNLFSMNKKMFVIRTTLEHGAYKEIIDIMYHDGTYDPQFISNKMLGDWMKKRTENNIGQFIYLNTSCSSYTKAAAELGSAESKNLVIVASTTSVYTFTTSPDNSSYYLFDGIRKMMDFKTITEINKANRGTYIFPNQESYKTMVIANINKGIDITSNVYKLNAEGNRIPYQIEQELNSHR